MVKEPSQRNKCQAWRGVQSRAHFRAAREGLSRFREVHSECTSCTPFFLTQPITRCFVKIK